MEEQFRDACRNCDEAIRFVRWDMSDVGSAPPGVPRHKPWSSAEDEIQRSYRMWHWGHVKTGAMACYPEVEGEQQKPGTAEPASRCSERKADGSGICNKPAREEFLAEDIIACGVHARQVKADKEHRERMAREAEARREEEEMRQWAASPYTEARDKLLAVPGAEEAFPDLKGFNPVQSYSRHLNTQIRVDVKALWEFVKTNKEDLEVEEEFEDWELGEEVFDDEEAAEA